MVLLSGYFAPVQLVLKFAHDVQVMTKVKPYFLQISRRHLRFDGLISVRENVHVHQIVNQLKGLDRDLFGKVANDYWGLSAEAYFPIHFTRALL